MLCPKYSTCKLSSTIGAKLWNIGVRDLSKACVCGATIPSYYLEPVASHVITRIQLPLQHEHHWNPCQNFYFVTILAHF